MTADGRANSIRFCLKSIRGGLGSELNGASSVVRTVCQFWAYWRSSHEIPRRSTLAESRKLTIATKKGSGSLVDLLRIIVVSLVASTAKFRRSVERKAGSVLRSF